PGRAARSDRRRGAPRARRSSTERCPRRHAARSRKRIVRWSRGPPNHEYHGRVLGSNPRTRSEEAPSVAEYAHPEVLVTTAWTEEHLKDPQVRILEVDYDPSSAYELGHIPGAVLVDWKKDINHSLRRDI